MYPKLQKILESAQRFEPPAERQALLSQVVDFIKAKKLQATTPILHFICTHNSRRSQFSQVWAQVAAHYHGQPLHAYSGGVEITACNERVIDTLVDMGFQVDLAIEGKNPIYHAYYQKDGEPIVLYSKLYDDSSLPKNGFAAIMTCSEADENCPFIPGAERRIPLRYKDPKIADNTSEEKATYLIRAQQIAFELNWIFARL